METEFVDARESLSPKNGAHGEGKNKNEIILSTNAMAINKQKASSRSSENGRSGSVSRSPTPAKRHLRRNSSFLVKSASKKLNVMISYNWGDQKIIIQVQSINSILYTVPTNQKIIIQLYRTLVESGFDVWLDIYEMEGDILEAMAEAVDAADVVLVAMCEKYKHSANCRAEAEYSLARRKKIIPLMMQENYEPRGWLGMVLGQKLYYKMHDEEAMQGSVTSLVGTLRKQKEIVAGGQTKLKSAVMKLQAFKEITRKVPSSQKKGKVDTSAAAVGSAAGAASSPAEVEIDSTGTEEKQQAVATLEAKAKSPQGGKQRDEMPCVVKEQRNGTSGSSSSNTLPEQSVHGAAGSASNDGAGSTNGHSYKENGTVQAQHSDTHCLAGSPVPLGAAIADAHELLSSGNTSSQKQQNKMEPQPASFFRSNTLDRFDATQRQQQDHHQRAIDHEQQSAKGGGGDTGTSTEALLAQIASLEGALERSIRPQHPQSQQQGSDQDSQHSTESTVSVMAKLASLEGEVAAVHRQLDSMSAVLYCGVGVGIGVALGVGVGAAIALYLVRGNHRPL
jgi:hypothetical protein